MSEQTLEDRLVNEVADLRKELLAIKTKQLIGGDNTVVRAAGSASAVTTITAGLTTFFTLTLVPTVPRVTLWDLAMTFFVDGVGFALANIYPDGSAMTAGTKKLRVSWWYDWIVSDDVSGTRRWRIRVENFDVADHIVGIQTVAYAISTAGTL